MSIVLSPDVVQQIEEQVRCGRYASADDVIRAGLQLLKDQREELEARREAIRQMVEEGRRELESGNYVEYDDESLKAFFEQVKADGRRRLGLPADAP
jgi:antitoxin ParD1/3/4